MFDQLKSSISSPQSYEKGNGSPFGGWRDFYQKNNAESMFKLCFLLRLVLTMWVLSVSKLCKYTLWVHYISTICEYTIWVHYVSTICENTICVQYVVPSSAPFCSSFCGGGESMVPFPAPFFHFLGVGEGGDLMVPSPALFFLHWLICFGH